MSETANQEPLQGSVLEVLSRLLAEGRTEEILEVVRKLVSRNESLEQQLAALLRRGTKSNEGISTDQLSLFLEQIKAHTTAANHENAPEVEEKQIVDERLLARAEAAAERARQKVIAEATAPSQKPLKKALPAGLPRHDNPIDVPEAKQACPSCGGPRDICGDDVSEVLELEPAKLWVRRDIRIKRICRTCDKHLVRAPRGPKNVEGGQIGCSVVAQIVVDKYEQGIPLNRQRRTFERLGISFSESTLCDQVKWGAELLTPLWLEAIDQILDAEVMHIDGTGLPVLDRAHPSGKRLGALWGTVGASAGIPVAAYFYASTKKAKGQRERERGPTDILAQRTGIVVADADTLFSAQMQREDIVDCGCNMHARRYFANALKGGDERAALVIGAFKGLYQVEEDAKYLIAEERLKLRRERSTPIYVDIVDWCRTYERDEPPKSPLGRAIRYLLRHEESLRRFETDGRIPIDNMAAEHGFVPVAITRKNFLFLGHDNGGDRAAILYTMIRCCRLAGVDPVAYLTDVLSILSGKMRRVEIGDLMPAQWGARRAGTGPESQA